MRSYIDEKSNVVGKIHGSKDSPILLFNGHLDQASTGRLERPFSGESMDGRSFHVDGVEKGFSIS